MPNEHVPLRNDGLGRKALTCGSEGRQVQQHYTRGPLVLLRHHRLPRHTAETIKRQKTPQEGFTFQEGCISQLGWGPREETTRSYWENKRDCNWRRLPEGGEGVTSPLTFEPDRAMVPRLETSSSWVIPIPVS